MAILVSYDHEYTYPYDDRGERCPILHIQLANPADALMAVEVDASIDSGTGKSLFDGELLPAIGLQLMDGQRQLYSSAGGYQLWAWLHQVIVSDPDLGSFRLKVGFSEVKIRRNLLGRDFFALIQIGFRERHSAFYMTSTP